MDAYPKITLKAEAVEWLVRLRDQDEDPEDPYPHPDLRWRAFCAWFTQSPEHLSAFMDAVEFSHELEDFDARRSIDLGRLFAAMGNVVQFPARRSPAATETGVARLIQHSGRFAIAACASMLCLLAIPFVVSSMRASAVIYRAGIGERVFLPLEDGSTVELNTRSRIDVRITPQGREVRLLSGEVVFDVRHDAKRPFRVVTNGVVIRDVGTRFAVRMQENGGTTVSVLEGSVEILTGESAPAIVAAQQEATVSVSAGHVKLNVRAVTALELRSQLAWQVGRLEFSGQTLADAVAKLNRYNRRQIRIVDSSIAQLTIGGSFFTTDGDAFLATIERLYHVRARPSPGNPNLIEISRASRQ